MTDTEISRPKNTKNANIFEAFGHVSLKKPVVVGNLVSIRDRICWVRLPSYPADKKQGSIDGVIHWWPGILYKNFGELMCDIDRGQTTFRAKCLLAHLQYKKKCKEEAPAVAYILGYEPTLIRTITSEGKDDANCITPICQSNCKSFDFFKYTTLGTEVRNFYDHYDDMEGGGTSPQCEVSSRQRHMFARAISISQELLTEDVGNVYETDNIPTSTFKSLSSQPHPPSDKTPLPALAMVPTVTDIKHSKKNVLDVSKAPSINQEVNAGPISDSSDISHVPKRKNGDQCIKTSTDQLTPTLNKVNDGTKRRKIDLISPFTTSSKSNSPKSTSDESISGIFVPKVKGTPVKSTDSWITLWDKLHHSGWHWKYGSGVIDKYFIKPGKTTRKGIEGVDYFTNPQDVKNFALKYYCNKKGKKQRSNAPDPSVPQTTAETLKNNKNTYEDEGDFTLSRMEDNFECENMVDVKIHNTNKQSCSAENDDVARIVAHCRSSPDQEEKNEKFSNEIPPPIKDSPIRSDDDWNYVWKKLRASGWTWKKGNMLCNYFYLKPGKKGSHEEVLGKDYFTSESEVQAYAMKHYQWSGKKKMEHEGTVSDNEELIDDNECIGTRKVDNEKVRSHHSSNPKKYGLSEIQGQNKKNTKDTKKKNSKDTKKRRDKKGLASKVNKKQTQYKTNKFSLVGNSPRKSSNKIDRKISKKGRSWGNPLNFGTPSNRNTRPQNPADPLSTGSTSTTSSSTQYDWRPLWDRLQLAGWKCISASRYNNLHNWYYVRPHCDVGDKNCQLGVDYFESQNDVIKFQKDLDKNDKEDNQTPDTWKSTSKKQPSRRVKGLLSCFSQDAISPLSLNSSHSDSVKSNCWWLESPIPDWTHAWKILSNKLCFKYSSYYQLPRVSNTTLGIGKFESIDDLRIHLCQNGIPNTTNNETFVSEEELIQVSRWASLAHLPKRINGILINSKTSVEVLQSVPTLSSKQVWRILEEKLAYKECDGKYYASDTLHKSHAALVRGKDYFHSLSELQIGIRNYGITSKRVKNLREVLSDEVHVALILWASLIPLPSYEILTEDTPICEGNEKSKKQIISKSPHVDETNVQSHNDLNKSQGIIDNSTSNSETSDKIPQDNMIEINLEKNNEVIHKYLGEISDDKSSASSHVSVIIGTPPETFTLSPESAQIYISETKQGISEDSKGRNVSSSCDIGSGFSVYHNTCEGNSGVSSSSGKKVECNLKQGDEDMDGSFHSVDAFDKFSSDNTAAENWLTQQVNEG
eukprot:CAMPEP_0184863322 /NCGR_PEP_ID=MMETSP0580-20130426/10510_1 /TAXON_ID=1118495 /ORGANISM="Dactyliosolen fragilissimus" /LENGTH=1256 /DNA_ID=CAMNT_0027361591 /DNA_START=116 /DNA_END=3886 /DNA_ORIENTATION=+